MTGSIIQALIYVIDIFTRLYLFILMLRFLLPWLRVNYNNPLTQGILKLTSPLVIPVRRFLPPIGRIDSATLLVMFGLEYLLIWLIAALNKQSIAIIEIIVMATFGLLSLALTLFTIAIVIRVILSWFAAGSHNPAIGVINAIADPILRPFRRLIPPLGGIDLSPLFAFVALGVAGILLGGIQSEVLGLIR